MPPGEIRRPEGTSSRRLPAMTATRERCRQLHQDDPKWFGSKQQIPRRETPHAGHGPPFSGLETWPVAGWYPSVYRQEKDVTQDSIREYWRLWLLTNRIQAQRFQFRHCDDGRCYQPWTLLRSLAPILGPLVSFKHCLPTGHRVANPMISR